MVKKRIILLIFLAVSFSTAITGQNKGSEKNWFARQWDTVKQKTSEAWDWITEKFTKEEQPIKQKKSNQKSRKKITEKDKQLILRAYKLQKLTLQLKKEEKKANMIKRAAIVKILLRS